MNGPNPTGPKAYILAIERLETIGPDDTYQDIAAKTAIAQALATLALTAATVEAAGLDTFEVEATDATGLTAWGKAVRRS